MILSFCDKFADGFYYWSVSSSETYSIVFFFATLTNSDLNWSIIGKPYSLYWIFINSEVHLRMKFIYLQRLTIGWNVGVWVPIAAGDFLTSLSPDMLTDPPSLSYKSCGEWGSFFAGSKAAWSSSWPLTSIWCRGGLYLKSPILLHGVVLNYFSTAKALILL
jgi:hypothetical protein